MKYKEFFEKLIPVFDTWYFYLKINDRDGGGYDIEDMEEEMIYGWPFVPEFKHIPKYNEKGFVIPHKFEYEEEEAIIKYFMENPATWIKYLKSLSPKFSEFLADHN